MLQGKPGHQDNESPIFGDLSLYKVLYSKRDNRPVIVHVDGGVSVIIPFHGINNTAFDEGTFEGLFKGLQTVLDELPPGICTVQFVSCRSSDVAKADPSTLPRFLRPRAEFFNQMAENNQIFQNEFYLSIFVAQPKVPTKKAIQEFIKKLIWKRDPLTEQYKKVMSSIDERISMCFEVMDQMVTMLSELNIGFNLLQSKDEYYNLLQKFTRPQKYHHGLVSVDNKDDEAPRQALFSGVRATVDKSSFVLDDTYHKVYTLDRAPKDFIYGRSLEVVHGVPYEYIYSMSFKTLTHQESINLFKYRLAEKRMASGTNENAIVEDRSLMADEARTSDAYDIFAYGEAIGTLASVSMVVKVKEDYIESQMRYKSLSRPEVLRKIDYRLQRDVFPRFGGSEWICEDNTAWPVFCQSVPGFANMNKDILKTLFLTTANLPYFMPLWDSRRDVQHDGVNHFVDEKGNYITFDLMDPSMPAWNWAISGETGSGKSVLVNALLTMQFAEANHRERPIICIIDVGGERGSYLKFMNLVKGTNINLSGTKKPHIQMFEINPQLSNPTPGKILELSNMLLPFSSTADESVEKLRVKVRNFYANVLDKGRNNISQKEMLELFKECIGFDCPPEFVDLLELKPGECEPTGKALNLILGIFEIILSTSAKEINGFRMFDYDQVLDFILETYRSTPGRFPYMTDYYNLVSSKVNSDLPEGRKFLTKIKNWTREGAFTMFDMDTDVDLANDVTLVDLKGLQNEPNLQLIYTLLFSELFSNKMYFTRGRRKIMIRDEAWSIMNNEKARKYLVEDLRTARKSGFATITITQLPTDFMNPDVRDGQAILANMQGHFLGKFNPSAVQHIAGEIDLPREMAEELTHLGQKKEIQPDGSFKTLYSRFMLKIGTEIYLLRNILHPFEYILYSSSEEDNAIIDYYLKITKKYDELEDVLWLISQRGHVGDEGLLAYLENAGYKNAARVVRGEK
jgi:hypothetical protein